MQEVFKKASFCSYCTGLDAGKAVRQLFDGCGVYYSPRWSQWSPLHCYCSLY